MNYLSVKLTLIAAIIFVSCFSIWAQKPLNSTEKAFIGEAISEVSKAVTNEAITDAERTKMVERSAKTLKEYGQPMAFPNGDIPLKTNREKEYRRVIAEVVYANDLRALLSNSLMSEQLSIVNSLQIEVAEEQIKFLIPGNAPFELSKDLVETVFSWNITEGANGGKLADTKGLVQKFRNLATSKELVKEVEKLYERQRELLIKTHQELKQTEELQIRLRKAYENAANSAFTFKDFQQQGAVPTKNNNSISAASTDNFKANIPAGWKVDYDKPGNWIASSNKKISAKTAQCSESFLNIKVTANSSSGTMVSGDIDKKLRSWMSESGLYPVEASIEQLSINGFKGKLLTSTLKYNDGFGSPVAGYKYGKAHIHGYAILVSDDGSRILKINYTVIAGSCWDNKSAQISKTEAMSGKSEAEKVVRSLTISGTKAIASASSAGINTPQNVTMPAKTTSYSDPRNLIDNKLREELLRELTSEPATSQEIKFWTEREKGMKKNPVQPHTKNETTTAYQSSADMLIGDWDLMANGFAGILEIRADGSALKGRVYYKVYNKWEPLEDLRFDPSTSQFTFYRPNAKQKHEGILNGTTLKGTFNGNSKWSAIKTVAAFR